MFKARESQDWTRLAKNQIVSLLHKAVRYSDVKVSDVLRIPSNVNLTNPMKRAGRRVGDYIKFFGQPKGRRREDKHS